MICRVTASCILLPASFARLHRAVHPLQPGFSNILRYVAAQGLAVLTALFWLFLIEIMPPRLGEYLWYAMLGLPLGFGYGFWRHKNQQHKNENIDKACARHAACMFTRQ